TERLLLRQFLEADVDLYSRMCADPETMRYIGDGRTLTREETWRAVAGVLGHWVLRGYGLYAVEEKATGQFVGRIGIINPEGWPGMEVGWLIGRQHWNLGYATEGARAVIRMAYEHLAAAGRGGRAGRPLARLPVRGGARSEGDLDRAADRGRPHARHLGRRHLPRACERARRRRRDADPDRPAAAAPDGGERVERPVAADRRRLQLLPPDAGGGTGPPPDRIPATREVSAMTSMFVP